MKNRIAILALFTVAAAITCLSSVCAQQTAPWQQASTSSPPEPVQSVWDGIYTEEQASRGAALYAQRCAHCHAPDLTGGEIAPALSSGEFKSNWSGLSVDDLVERIKVSMPQDNPGSLSRQQTADIVAFVLSKNGFPAGKTELAREAEVLKAFRFEANKPEIAGTGETSPPLERDRTASAVTALGGLTAQSPQNGPPESFSVSVSTTQTSVKAGSELKISVVLTNLSNQDMELGWDRGSRGEFDYTILVSDRDGHEPPDTQYFRAVRGKDSSNPDGKTQLLVVPSSGLRQVKPGATLTDSMYLNRLYDLKPGEYTVQVERTDVGRKTVVKSNTLTITVNP